MTVGEKLVVIMLEDGVEISSVEQEKAVNAINKAVDEKKIYWIGNKQGLIGFATYKEKEDKVLLNYCFIYKRFRDRCNLLSLRKFFRDKYDNFIWHSRRRNRMCFVK